MLDVFVINLKDSIDRREAVAQRLNSLSVQFEVFGAVDGRVNPHPLFKRYDDRERIKYRRTRLSGGELGCFASHYLLWEKCIELGRPILILEDDLVIEDFFPEALELVQGLLPQFHFVRLAGISLHRRPYKVLGKVGKFELIDHVRGPAGTQAYALDPTAAKSLIEHARVWSLPVDDYIDRYWEHGVDSFGLMPFPVKLADVESDMVRNKKGKRPLLEKLKQELYGRAERIRRNIYRIKARDRKKVLEKSL